MGNLTTNNIQYTENFGEPSKYYIWSLWLNMEITYKNSEKCCYTEIQSARLEELKG